MSLFSKPRLDQAHQEAGTSAVILDTKVWHELFENSLGSRAATKAAASERDQLVIEACSTFFSGTLPPFEILVDQKDSLVEKSKILLSLLAGITLQIQNGRVSMQDAVSAVTGEHAMGSCALAFAIGYGGNFTAADLHRIFCDVARPMDQSHLDYHELQMIEAFKIGFDAAGKILFPQRE